MSPINNRGYYKIQRKRPNYNKLKIIFLVCAFLSRRTFRTLLIYRRAEQGAKVGGWLILWAEGIGKRAERQFLEGGIACSFQLKKGSDTLLGNGGRVEDKKRGYFYNRLLNMSIDLSIMGRRSSVTNKFVVKFVKNKKNKK